MMDLAFVGARYVARRRVDGALELHPFAAVAAGHRQQPPRVMDPTDGVPIAIGLDRTSVVVLSSGPADGLTLQWTSSRGHAVRRMELPRGDFALPPEEAPLGGLIPAPLARGGSAFFLRDARDHVYRLDDQGLMEILSGAVPALAEAKGGGAHGIQRCDEGFQPLVLGTPPSGPPVLVPEVGEQVFLGYMGRALLPWGLNAVERQDGRYLLAAGSPEERSQELPPCVEPVGVARERGSTGEVSLLCLRDDGRTLVIVGESGERGLPATRSRCVATALSTIGPFVATCSEEGELIVRSLTGPGDRRLYRHRSGGILA